MQEYVFTPMKITEEPYTTADVIAEYSSINHHAVNKMIHDHLDLLSRYAHVAFEMQRTPAGRQKKVYILNQEQATTLVEFLKNTKPVLEFKTELSHQFYIMRDMVLKNRIAYEQGKIVSKSLGDAIKERGNSKPYDYANFNKLIYKAALGVTTKQLKVSRHIAKGDSMTQYLTADEANAVQRVKGQVVTLLELKMDYLMIKQIIARQGIIYQVTLPTRQEVISHE